LQVGVAAGSGGLDERARECSRQYLSLPTL
jgi:hypothetical protein